MYDLELFEKAWKSRIENISTEFLLTTVKNLEMLFENDYFQDSIFIDFANILYDIVMQECARRLNVISSLTLEKAIDKLV